MTAFTPDDTHKSWRTERREATVQLYLSEIQGEVGSVVGARPGGYPLDLSVVPVTDWIDPAEMGGAIAAVVQIDADTPASIKRFNKLASATQTPLIAAAYDPPLALVRSLLRSGAHDVLALPLDVNELVASLTNIAEQRPAGEGVALAPASSKSKIVSVIKTVGGVGATALACQLAIRFALSEAKAGREACLIDLDVQFGDAAFQLGLKPRLSLIDLVEAGGRLDGSLVRSTTVTHSSGLSMIAAPSDMLPLESLSSDQIIDIVDHAAREFGTVFLELPTNWTNWSLSLLARSDIVLLVTELSVASLHRARRQLDLIASQDLGELDVRVVVNRFEKSQMKALRAENVRNAIGRDVSFTVANDWQLMSAASDRGVPIDDLKRKSAVGKDLDTLNAALAAALKLER